MTDDDEIHQPADLDGQTSAYAALGPNQVLDAVESRGYRCDGALLALNSYENRVYRVGIEDGPALVAKFYRPGRWSDAAILEEHAFSRELAAAELPFVAPLPAAPTNPPADTQAGAQTGQMADPDRISLFRHAQFRFALYPNQGGRAPDLEDAGSLEQLGRLVARVHNIGALRRFEHRPTLDIDQFGVQSRAFLLDQGFIPAELETAYDTLTADLIEQVRAAFGRAGNPTRLRLHGDCHPGNILWADDGPHFVDLDDARLGPAIQDLWMFVTGDRDEMTRRLADLLEGYTQFRDFDPRELHLVEALRTLRMVHHAAWLARRWQDPAFPRAFPWFNTQRYWGDHILSLREQAALLQEPPLVWD